MEIKIKGVKVEPVDCSEMDRTEYAYGLVTRLSEVKFLSGKEAAEEPFDDELLEARFFDEKRELHIWREPDGLRAVLAEETDEANPIRSEFEVTAALGGVQTLQQAQYLAYDEDGQAYIALTRLCGARKAEG